MLVTNFNNCDLLIRNWLHGKCPINPVWRRFTATSRLQYQKWLRLNEARRLILDEHMGATQACVQVGDDSASQFNHEYSRLFGAPPKQELQATWHKGAGSVSHRIGWIANLARQVCVCPSLCGLRPIEKVGRRAAVDQKIAAGDEAAFRPHDQRRHLVGRAGAPGGHLLQHRLVELGALAV